MSHQVYPGTGGIKFRHFVGSQSHRGGTKKVIQMDRIGRAGNRNYPRFSREHPYQGELRRSHAFAFRPLLNEINQRHIVFQRFRLELRQVIPSVTLLETAVLVDHTGKKCTA